VLEEPEKFKFFKELMYTQVLTIDLLGSIIDWRGGLLPVRSSKNRPFGRRKGVLGEKKIDVSVSLSFRHSFICRSDFGFTNSALSIIMYRWSFLP
jgi:hypothetical protein